MAIIFHSLLYAENILLSLLNIILFQYALGKHIDKTFFVLTVKILFNQFV